MFKNIIIFICIVSLAACTSTQSSGGPSQTQAQIRGGQLSPGRTANITMIDGTRYTDAVVNRVDNTMITITPSRESQLTLPIDEVRSFSYDRFNLGQTIWAIIGIAALAALLTSVDLEEARNR